MAESIRPSMRPLMNFNAFSIPFSILTLIMDKGKQAVNRNSASIKRLMQEARELSNPPPGISGALSTPHSVVGNTDRPPAAPLADNLFDWHFTVRGPPCSAFADGVYHGRLLMPHDYPFAPPSFLFFTPSGAYSSGFSEAVAWSGVCGRFWGK